MSRGKGLECGTPPASHAGLVLRVPASVLRSLERSSLLSVDFLFGLEVALVVFCGTVIPFPKEGKNILELSP